MLDIQNIPLDDQKTWDLIKSGRTGSIFQLESHLGKHWCKKIRPSNIEELSAVVSLLRPGCLQAYSGDPPKNMAQRYADRKNGLEKIEYYHESLEPMLNTTLGVLCIHEDTFIATTNGIEKPIKYINPNDDIISVNQDTLLHTKNKCLAVCKSPKTHGVRLVLSNGFTIILTDDHEVCTQRGYIKVKDLDINNDIVQISRKQYKIIKDKILHDFDSIKDCCNTLYVSKSHITKRKQFTSCSFAEKCGINFGEIAFMKIHSITPIDKKQQFYSISVSNDHNLIGNGIVIKNCYQEQTMAIASKIAGFTPEEANTLRKGIGRKLASVIAELENKFIDGCKKVGIVNDKEAEEIFSWIEASNRYAFNRCLSPNTLVETKGGYKTLEEVSVGEQILCPINQWHTIINKYDNEQQELYEITLDSGKTITCTLEHQFLCQDHKKRPLLNIIQENYQILCEDE